jgi:hypothetical protein
MSSNQYNIIRAPLDVTGQVNSSRGGPLVSPSTIPLLHHTSAGIITSTNDELRGKQAVHIDEGLEALKSSISEVIGGSRLVNTEQIQVVVRSESNNESLKKRYKCTQEGCDYSTSHSGTLKAHIMRHTGEKPYICQHEGCNYRCITAGSMTVHERQHSGEKPFKCSFEGCDFACIRGYQLNIHYRQHTGEKPFKCKVEGCNYSSARMKHYRIHLRKHSGEKPFKCTFDGCTYATSRSDHLPVHMRRHTGEKPFKCGSCDYRAIDRSTCNKHVRRNHKDDPKACVINVNRPDVRKKFPSARNPILISESSVAVMDVTTIPIPSTVAMEASTTTQAAALLQPMHILQPIQSMLPVAAPPLVSNVVPNPVEHGVRRLV